VVKNKFIPRRATSQRRVRGANVSSTLSLLKSQGAKSKQAKSKEPKSKESVVIVHAAKGSVSSEKANIQTVMVIACHPDDVEIGMGGTIASLIAAGVQVIIADLTNGEPTPHGSPEIRAKETKEANIILGITKRIIIGLKNREIQDTIENRKKVANVIRRYRPEIIFSHYWNDAHPDHVAASTLVDNARFYAKLTKTDLEYEPYFPRKIIYFHAMHLKASINPSFIYDISAFQTIKSRAVAAYRSQFANNPKNLNILERLKHNDSYWGGLIAKEYGEPFTLKEVLAVTNDEALLNV